MRTETSSYIYIYPKQNPYTFKDLFIHGIKYITNLCKLITKSSWLVKSGFSSLKMSRIECAEQETRHRVKLKTKGEMYLPMYSVCWRWITWSNVWWKVVTRMRTVHMEIRRCPWGGRCTRDAGHHRCHQSLKLWARTWFQVSRRATIEQKMIKW